MEKCRCRIVPILCLASAAATLTAQANVIERAGRNYRVVFHTADLAADVATPLVEAALAAVEEFVPTLKKLVGAPAGTARVIHLYRDEKEYRAVETSDGPWKCLLEAFVTRKGVAHVWLWPQLDAEMFAHTGLPQTTREGLLRVAAKMVIEPKIPDSVIDEWVKWILVMGAVESFTNPEHEDGVDWAHDFRRQTVAAMRGRGEHETLLGITRYAVKVTQRHEWDWLMCHSALVAQTMATVEPRWARKLLARHRPPRDLRGDLPLRDVAIAAVFGKKMDKATLAFGRIWAAANPQFAHRAGVWNIGAKRSLLVGSREDAASLLNARPLPAGDYAVAGRMELGPGRENYVRIAFAFDGGSTLAAHFEVNAAGVSEWSHAQGRWSQQATVELPLARDVPFEFRVEVTGSEVRLVVDGTKVCLWRHGGRNVHEFVAIEVNDRVVWLTDLRIEPLHR